MAMKKSAFDLMFVKNQDAKSKLGEALSKQKNKFLIAINNNTTGEWTNTDDVLHDLDAFSNMPDDVLHDLDPFSNMLEDDVLHDLDPFSNMLEDDVLHDLDPFSNMLEDDVLHDLDPFSNMLDYELEICNKYLSLPWDDTKGINAVHATLNSNAVFYLPKYLNCATTVLVAYSGKPVTGLPIYKAMEYVLSQARQFGAPYKTMFSMGDNVSSAIPIIEENIISKEIPLSSLPQSKFMDRFKELANDLRACFDETKFRELNVNVTYITLLMTRRVVKNDLEFKAAMKRTQTHEAFVRMCPWPFDRKLPTSDTSKLIQSSLIPCARLAIYAYLNSSDNKTKRVLQGTCVTYMKWCGLQLTDLFFQVAEIYKMDVGTLWDVLCLDETAESLVRLADYHYNKYQDLKKDPSKTYDWFPYCRVLLQHYHKDLSARENEKICYILAYLIDFKIGIDKSTVRLSHWAKSAEKKFWSESLRKYAKEVYDKYGSQ